MAAWARRGGSRQDPWPTRGPRTAFHPPSALPPAPRPRASGRADAKAVRPRPRAGHRRHALEKPWGQTAAMGLVGAGLARRAIKHRAAGRRPVNQHRRQGSAKVTVAAQRRCPSRIPVRRAFPVGAALAEAACPGADPRSGPDSTMVERAIADRAIADRMAADRAGQALPCHLAAAGLAVVDLIAADVTVVGLTAVAECPARQAPAGNWAVVLPAFPAEVYPAPDPAARDTEARGHWAAADNRSPARGRAPVGSHLGPGRVGRAKLRRQGIPRRARVRPVARGRRLGSAPAHRQPAAGDIRPGHRSRPALPVRRALPLRRGRQAAVRRSGLGPPPAGTSSPLVFHTADN